MVRKTQDINGNGRETTQKTAGVGRNLASLASDVVTLAELQGQLLSFDARESARRTARPAGMLIAGAIAACAGILLLLTATALLLSEQTVLSPATAFLLVAVVTLLGSAGLLYSGWKRLQPVLHVFRRSSNEFVENLNALKSALSRQKGPLPRG